MISIDRHTIKLCPISSVANLSDIPECDVGRIHHSLYRVNRFVAPSPASVLLTEEQEIIKAEQFHFCTMKNDTCVSDSLRSNVLFEKFLLSFLSKIVPADKNMLDVGANIGIWSVVFSTFIKGTIYAFEPQTKIYECLTNNIAINRCANVKPYHVALSDKQIDYKMNASYNKNDNFGAFRICPEGELSINAEIGDVLQLRDIGFIKMDVEGHELEAINGLATTIATWKPILFVEIHGSHPNANQTYLRIKELGYTHALRLTHCDFLFMQPA